MCLQWSDSSHCWYKWEHWILHQIIECSPGKFVQLHKILKIGEFSLLPADEVRGAVCGRGHNQLLTLE